MTTLGRMTAGARGRVCGLIGTGPFAQRLAEVGLIPGVEVTVVRFAPLGDPMQVRVRNGHLALRRAEAEGINVLPIPG